MNSMKNQISNIFDTDKAFISDEFVEANLDNFDKLVNGTEEESKAAAEAI
jgi:hypothetical protein